MAIKTNAAPEFKSPEEKAADKDAKTAADRDAFSVTPAESNPKDSTPVGAGVEKVDDSGDYEGYTFVRFPDGSVRALRSADIQQSNNGVAGIQNLTGPSPEEDNEEVYAWLADGSVERVKRRDLPGAAGTNAVNGYFKRDKKQFQIIAVHPVEHE